MEPILSYRRELLDRDLASVKKCMAGLVLDIGGGSHRGQFQRVEEAVWVVVDSNRELHPTVIADAQHLPVKDRCVDAVKCTEVMEYVENPEQALEEIHRVLKIGGMLVFSMPFNLGIHYDKDIVRYTKHKIEKLLNGRFTIIIFKEQGLYFTVLCYMIKQALLNAKSRARWLLYWTFPILDTIAKLDGCAFVRSSEFMSSFTTGYFALGVKK